MTSGSWTDPSTTSLGEEKKITLESKTHDTLKSIYNIFDQTICEESFKNSALIEGEPNCLNLLLTSCEIMQDAFAFSQFLLHKAHNCDAIHIL